MTLSDKQNRMANASAFEEAEASGGGRMSQPDPILRVTPGTPIYTQDGQKIGKVALVRGRAFKVETGMFQRDYWLPAECIETAAASDAVMLAINKGDLGNRRIAEPTAAA